MQLTNKQKEQFHNDGYIIIKKLLSDNEIKPILQACYDTDILDEHASSNKDFDGNESFRAAFWRDPKGDTLLSKLPLMPRIAGAADQLLATESYYWRSRLVFKKPFEPGKVEWHQDYSFWYRDGCVFPDMLSCSVAITPSNKENGCLEVLKGSHKIGRLDLESHQEGAEYPNPEFVAKIADKCERVFCELGAGDGIIFHSNTLHASGPNTTNSSRVLVHNTYNAHYNEPIKPPDQSDLLAESQRYEPLLRVDDEFILKGDYSSVFDEETFFPTETTEDNDIGIFKRSDASSHSENFS